MCDSFSNISHSQSPRPHILLALLRFTCGSHILQCGYILASRARIQMAWGPRSHLNGIFPEFRAVLGIHEVLNELNDGPWAPFPMILNTFTWWGDRFALYSCRTRTEPQQWKFCAGVTLEWTKDTAINAWKPPTARKEAVTECVQAEDEKQSGGNATQGNPRTRLVYSSWNLYFFSFLHWSWVSMQWLGWSSDEWQPYSTEQGTGRHLGNLRLHYGFFLLPTLCFQSPSPASNQPLCVCVCYYVLVLFLQP